jgi:hypothetical protein
MQNVKCYCINQKIFYLRLELGSRVFQSESQ